MSICVYGNVMKTINQAQAAQVLGFKKSFFCRVLSGDRNLRYPAAKKLALRLGCRPEVFLDDGGGTPDERRMAVEKAINATIK